MKGINEHESFSRRLQQSLRNANYAPDSGTLLAREFNRRYTGKPITPHAARKWLIGESIPTQAKLVVLAKWLNVPAAWLRYGAGRDNEDATSQCKLEARDAGLIRELSMLDENQRLLVREFIRMLIRVSRASRMKR